jgi:hypothetical protein
VSNRKIIYFTFREVGLRNPELWVLCDDGSIWMKPTSVPIHCADTESIADRKSWKQIEMPVKLFSQKAQLR